MTTTPEIRAAPERATALTLAEGLRSAVARWPASIAVSDGSRRITYAQLGSAIADLAAAYARLGVRPGDRVICQLSNCPEHLAAMGAAWVSGCVHVGADHELTGHELSWLARHTEARVLLFEPPQGAADPLAPARAVRAARPQTSVLLLGDAAGVDGLEEMPRLATGADPAGEPSAAWPHPGPAPGDVATIFFTSGTTGTPKGPMATQGGLAGGWGWYAGLLELSPGDIHLGQLPLSHGFGMSLAYMALSTGGHLTLMRRFRAGEALRRITDERVTVLNGTPAHFILLTDRLDPARHDVRSLRIGVGSAASFPPQLLRRIFDQLGMDLMLMYGSSEGVGLVTMDRDEMLAGSVGRPDPGYVAIVGPDRRALPTGAAGEIAFNREVTEVRYWAETAAAAEAMTPAGGDGDRWYYSGDVGRLDEAGRLYVLGRLKHQIDRGGLKVDPGEVERALMAAPGVLDAAVVGVPNPVLGESVCACVVPEAGAVLTLEALRREASATLAPHKLPEELCLLKAIPRTELGKVDRSALRAAIEAAGPRQRLRPG